MPLTYHTGHDARLPGCGCAGGRGGPPLPQADCLHARCSSCAEPLPLPPRGQTHSPATCRPPPT